MDRELAMQIVEELLEADNMGSLGFDLQQIFESNDIIENFHSGADTKEHVGVFKISLTPNESYYITFIDWRETGNYYVVVFDSNRNRPFAEIHQVMGDNKSLDLYWIYKPTKRDGKNSLRKDYFKKYFGETMVRISIPQNEDEVDIFLQNLVTLVKNRVKADELNPSLEYREGFPEGMVLERLHKLRERNSQVTKLAKKNSKRCFGKLICEICGFSFEDTYGELGAEYIEAHHTIPVSELKEGHATKVEDIALVCCNCHQMLHRRRPWLQTNELKDILKNYN